MSVLRWLTACAGAAVYWYLPTFGLLYELAGHLLVGSCFVEEYWSPWTVRLMDEYPWIERASFIFSRMLFINTITIVLKFALRGILALKKWLQSNRTVSTVRETKHQKLLREQRQQANGDLTRLRDQLKADLKAVRQAKKFEDTGLACTAAIRSLISMINHIKYRGDENGSTVVKRTDRQLKVKLYTQRAAAHVELGRYHSAADDYVRVLANATSTYYVQGSTLRGGRREMFLRKGDALLMAGDIEEAGRAYQQGLLQDGLGSWDNEFKRGLDNVVTVQTDTASSESALKRLAYGEAIMSAKRALARAPNYEIAQKLILDALSEEGRWLEARQACEEWAYKLDRCNWKSERRAALDRFAKGGGPPWKYIDAMHVSLKEGYCKALRNSGTSSDLIESLAVACELRLAWATDLARPEQAQGTDQGQVALSSIHSQKIALEHQLKRQAKKLLEIKEWHEREIVRFDNERKKFASEVERFQTSKRGFERERTRFLGPLASVSEKSREMLASIPGLEKVLEDCVICHECLLKDVEQVSFGVMSYSCDCSSGSRAPRMMHVDCTVSMNELTCPMCRSPIVIIAPSMPGGRQTRSRTFMVKRSTSVRDEPSAQNGPRQHADDSQLVRRVAEAAAHISAGFQAAARVNP